MTGIALILSLLMGSAAFTRAYSRAGLDAAVPWLLLLTLFWLIAEWRRWRWFSALGLFTYIAFAAYGLWINLPASLMLIGALGGLLAWDLSDFSTRLRLAAFTEDARGIELRHLVRLLIFAILGLLLAGVTRILRIRMTFEVVLGLVIVTAIGLALLIRWLGMRNE